MNTFRIFEISHLLATNTKGVRIKLTDTYYGEFVFIARKSNSTDTGFAQAIEFLLDKKITLDGKAHSPVADYIITKDFETRIK